MLGCRNAARIPPCRRGGVSPVAVRRAPVPGRVGAGFADRVPAERSPAGDDAFPAPFPRGGPDTPESEPGEAAAPPAVPGGLDPDVAAGSAGGIVRLPIRGSLRPD